MAINPYTKKGWFWENILIENQVPHVILNTTEVFQESLQLDALPPGTIYMDMKLWGMPEEYYNLWELEGSVEASIVGLKPGTYEVYVSYYNHLGSLGPIKQTVDLDGNISNLIIPESNPEEFGYGSSVLKLNTIIKPFDNNFVYQFDDKAIGANVYLKHIISQTWGPDNYDPQADIYWHICDLNFAKGWKKIGDYVGTYTDEYTSFITINDLQDTSPGIMSFTGDIYNTVTESTSEAYFTYFNPPIIPEYRYSNNLTGSSKYRWKTSAVHSMKSWIGNVAEIKTKFRNVAGEPLENWGNILTTNYDRLVKSRHRNYDDFNISDWVDVVNEDGDELVALKSFADLLFQFKRNKIFILRTEGEKTGVIQSVNTGVNHESCIAVTPHGVCWANKKGVYLFTNKGFINLTKEKLDFEKLFYEELGDYYDYMYFVPVLTYIPKTNQLMFFLQTALTQEDPFDTLDALGQAADLNNDGIINIVDAILIANAFGGNIKVQMIYDFETRSWVEYGSSSANIPGGQKTNIITQNKDVVFFDKEDKMFYKWDEEPYSNDFFTVQTGFLDFDYPTLRKRIKSITITWKMSEPISSDSGPNIKVFLKKDSNNSSQLTPVGISGTKDVGGKIALKNSGYTSGEGVSTHVTKIKPSGDDDDVYNISVELLAYDNVDKNFELLDISMSYQYKGVK